MLNYYKERIEKSEEKLRLAKIGFQSELKAMGESLMNAKTYEETDLVFTSVKKSREAVEALESEVKGYKEDYEREANKPENKKAQAKEILFGGNE